MSSQIACNSVNISSLFYICCSNVTCPMFISGIECIFIDRARLYDKDKRQFDPSPTDHGSGVPELTMMMNDHLIDLFCCCPIVLAVALLKEWWI